MENGKHPTTVIVLALEIATIVILHAIKISQSEKPVAGNGKEVTRNIAPAQPDTRIRTSFLAALK